MSESGRDRDPAFRRRRATSASTPRKPRTTAPKKEPAAEKPASAPKEPTPSKTQAPPPPAPPTASAPKPAEKPAENAPKKKSPDATSKKSKLIGIIVSLIVATILVLGGFYAVQYILKTEAMNMKGHAATMNEGHEDSAMHDAENANENSEGSEESGEEMTLMEDGEETEEASSESGNHLDADTELSEENSIETEMKEVEEKQPDETKENQEREALKTRIIRKKGQFEIPCWIIAFSANSKKPLANVNYSELEALGYDAGIYWIPKYFENGKELYKVYVGPYKSPDEAESVLPAIRNMQSDAYIMKIE
ncbi:SPOR domain-containing protein [bacterium SCSIO 12741]|nr:SPOR domain-containing protein [bacterium SCSIO 12741]